VVETTDEWLCQFCGEREANCECDNRDEVIDDSSTSAIKSGFDLDWAHRNHFRDPSQSGVLRYWSCDDLKNRLLFEANAIKCVYDRFGLETPIGCACPNCAVRDRLLVMVKDCGCKQSLEEHDKHCALCQTFKPYDGKSLEGAGTKTKPPTYCAGCSFKCQASDCDCTCHDKVREYYAKKACEVEKK
jgi:hypothetical protein